MESDALSDLLTLFRVRASVYLHAHFCGDWAVDVADHKKIPFHVVGAGHCWLHLNGSESPIPLAAGDLVVFPHDMPHSLSELPERPGPLVPRNQPAGAKPTSTSFTTLVCGDFELERRFWNPLLDALPEVIVIPHDDTRNTARLRTLLDVIVFEASVEEPGGKAVIDKLAEAIFIHVIRVHLARDDLKTEGYVAALADRHIGRALQAIHRNPEFKWSVDRIAQIAGQSRSAFTERFHRTVGVTPMQYVTRWRMRRAQELLTTGDESIAQIAQACGYESEAAFSRVFKSRVGVGPGTFRRNARQ